MVFKKEAEGDVSSVKDAKIAVYSCPFDGMITETKVPAPGELGLPSGASGFCVLDGLLLTSDDCVIIETTDHVWCLKPGLYLKI